MMRIFESLKQKKTFFCLSVHVLRVLHFSIFGQLQVVDEKPAVVAEGSKALYQMQVERMP